MDCVVKYNKVKEVMNSKQNLLDVRRMQEDTRCKWVSKEIVYFEEVGSTNVEATRLATEGKNHGTLVLADSQSGGRGRRGRNWHTPKSTSIAMSIILKPKMEAEYASMLTLIQAMAVAKAVEDVSGLYAQIKWPNDILVNEKKVCGILTEMNLSGSKISSIIIGTGINVNQEEFPEEIADIATSLKREAKAVISREELIEKICHYFEKFYESFMQTKDLSAIMEEYNKRLVSVGRRVKVLDPMQEFTGEALGINSKGELLVKKENGQIANVYAGEVSVRGIYGYV